MSTTTIYAHPDGHEITVGYGLLTACTSDGFALSMPIGPDGLAALGAALIERSIAQKHGEVSERAGAATNTPEILPGLHPTSAEAMAQAEAVMDAQPDTHTAAVRRIKTDMPNGQKDFTHQRGNHGAGGAWCAGLQ